MIVFSRLPFIYYNNIVFVSLFQGISGPSSVYVNVICERKHTSDPVSKHNIQLKYFSFRDISFYSNDFSPFPSVIYIVSQAAASCLVSILLTFRRHIAYHPHVLRYFHRYGFINFTPSLPHSISE